MTQVEREFFDARRPTLVSRSPDGDALDRQPPDRELATRNTIAGHADVGIARVPRPDAVNLLNAVDHAILVIDAEGRVVTLNDGWERAVGRPARECVRRDAFACFPFLVAAPGAELLRATSDDGATRQFETGWERDGRVERFGVRVARMPDGLLLLELMPSEDRTRARADALALQHEENAALRELARQMAAVADSRALLELLCEMASTQCGATGAAVVKSCTEHGEVVAATGDIAIAHARRFPLAGSVVQEVLQTRATVLVERFTSAARPLTRVVPELAIGPMVAAPLVAHGTQLGVLSVVRGERATMFTAREVQRLRVIADHAALAMWKAQLLEQSQAADLAKGRFLATISHELRTPLTALTGYEELLADQVLGPLTASQTDVVERMRSVTHHLTMMIEEVLAYSSIEAGREVVRPMDFLADDLVRAVVAIMEPLARQKRLVLASDYPAEPLRITSDIDKVRQVLVNLTGNAVKFTDRGEVRLTLERRRTPEGCAEIHFGVHDTGSGIAPDDLQRLFRPFAQVDTGLTRRHGGTGLGLYISHRLAQLLGGRLEVDSEPGAGSTFTLVLPG